MTAHTMMIRRLPDDDEPVLLVDGEPVPGEALVTTRAIDIARFAFGLVVEGVAIGRTTTLPPDAPVYVTLPKPRLR